MKLGVILTVSTALVCTGCTTVNLQTMAGSPDKQAAAEVEDRNVVQRAVEKLRNAFASRGFGEKTSQKKMHAAANMLLNGLSARSVSSASADYIEHPKPRALILEDVTLAQRHVDQTQRAAEVYLEVAPLDRDVKDELESLEEALMASEKAILTFKAALTDMNAAELDALKISVDELRSVTDRFGDRVRASKSADDKAATQTG